MSLGWAPWFLDPNISGETQVRGSSSHTTANNMVSAGPGLLLPLGGNVQDSDEEKKSQFFAMEALFKSYNISIVSIIIILIHKQHLAHDAV